MEANLFNTYQMVSEVRVDLYNKVPLSKCPKVFTSYDAMDIFRRGWEELNYRETMKALFLNRTSRVIGIRELSKGGIVGTIVDVGMVFQAALGCNATSIILAHNHPSGGLTPSDADREITRKVKEAGVIMDIRLTDHLIITDEGYFSFADEGLI